MTEETAMQPVDGIYGNTEHYADGSFSVCRTMDAGREPRVRADFGEFSPRNAGWCMPKHGHERIPPMRPERTRRRLCFECMQKTGRML